MKKLMRTFSFLVAVFFILGVVSLVQAAPKIEAKQVKYEANGVTMIGYLAYDKKIIGKRPAILVVHEWWGHNSYARKRALMLVEMGYTALAVDMYGEGKQLSHPKDAMKFSSETMKNFPVAKQRFQAAIDFLKKQPTVDSNNIGAIGYCFGGGIVLNMVRQGIDLKAVASFHGSLAVVEAAKPGTIKAKIRVYNGEDDKFIPQAAIDALKKEMEENQVDFKFVNYPGAIHSFTNTESTKIGKKFNLPMAYNENADKKSWEDMKEFFKEVFKK